MPPIISSISLLFTVVKVWLSSSDILFLSRVCGIVYLDFILGVCCPWQLRFWVWHHTHGPGLRWGVTSTLGLFLMSRQQSSFARLSPGWNLVWFPEALHPSLEMFGNNTLYICIHNLVWFFTWIDPSEILIPSRKAELILMILVQKSPMVGNMTRLWNKTLGF